MQEAEFHDLIDTLFRSLEDGIDESELDADFENQGSVFTVTVEGCAPLILNRHGPSKQLWLAAQSGGYHMVFDAADSSWRCTRSGQDFKTLWDDACQAQFGQLIEF